MAGETDDEIPESGAVFTFGKSKFADNAPSKFWLKNDVPLRISCGDEHTALVTENGKLFMFGSNNWGQLGLGTKTTVNKPTCVKALKSERVKLAACGRTHTLVYTSRGNLYASGGNNEGQLGLGDCDDRTSFHLVDFFSKHEPVKMLAAGSNTSAALTQDGRLYMWGDNSEGQIGLGKESNALNPREVSVGKRVSWVSCGYYHSAFVTVDGALYTFGEKDSGKLGLSTEKLASHKLPQQVTGVSDKVVQVSCGGGHTVALTEHEVYSFGLGQFGQLGHGTFIFESRLPRVVEHFRRGRVKHVECGENHTALITDSGLLYTFGDGRHGKLGLGEENFTNQFKPTLCPRFLDYYVHSVTCGGCHMLVLAKPRPEGSEDLILEEDDVTEDYFEKSYTELLGDTHSQTTLNRSLSARIRRRERERSPDQFGQMFRTLPALGGNQLSASLSVPSQIHHSHRKQPGKIPHNSLKIPGRREKSLDDRSSVKDSESLKDLGETTDLLNLTHIMKMDPSDKTLTLSPMEKLRTDEMNGKVEGEDDEEEECLDDEEEEEEEHPEEEEGEKCDEKEDILDEKRKEMEKQEQSITESDVQKKQIIREESVPDGPKKDSDPATLIKEETQSEMNRVTEDKPKTLNGSRNRLSLFKRSSTKGNQAEMSTSGKPAADGPPQISESSSSEMQIGGQTTASSRSRSATCNLL
ncbi:X-linked retinitis pigmentosa GTPase regulator-like [Sinocyclocheilus anshuiensis]|uniref:X-linked retinitis pigmentosa GTPase regulator n=1 Tax=Sinocyclocheilus anshuiensis TaxID=1608454 RepID=A0A671NUG1_9TELE|nr:PREDICTED: X-linked retinitis pigmentosa GTPase regulator-like [Sinocyclocheilus anshuiensis]